MFLSLTGDWRHLKWLYVVAIADQMGCTDKLRIVTEATYHKFTISADAARLRTMLLATGERELVEASPFDRVWGIGFREADAEWNREVWGENLLGRALMDVRARLREEEQARKEGKDEEGKGEDEGKGKGKWRDDEEKE
jgi:hypothetical protein